MSIFQEIPKGLGDELLQKKFGKSFHKITDLLLEKSHIELTLAQKPNDSLKYDLEERLDSIHKEIQVYYDYLRAWYSSYYFLCSKCCNCIYNHKGEYCTFYGKNNIPQPNPQKPNSVCDAYKSKKSTNIPINN